MYQYVLLGLTVFSLIENIKCPVSCPTGYVASYGVCDECGVPDVFPNAKIVGGVQALEKSYPYQALVIQSYKGIYRLSDGRYYLVSSSHFCGGTLINRYTVITAGSCIKYNFTHYDDYNYPNVLNTYPSWYYKTLESTFKVYLGTNDKNLTSSTSPNAIVVGVLKAIRHEGYDSTNNLNDIGVLILNKSVNINSYIKPACLPNASFSYPNESSGIYAAGWGVLNERDTSSPRYLQNVKLTVYNSSYCALVYSNNTKNWKSQICAGNYSGYQDTCQGDSGSGVYSLDTLGNKSRFIVSGLVSYGYGCARNGYPRIYTRVSYFIDWIQFAMNNYSSIDTNLNSNCVNKSFLSLIMILVSIYYLVSFQNLL